MNTHAPVTPPDGENTVEYWKERASILSGELDALRAEIAEMEGGEGQ